MQRELMCSGISCHHERLINDADGLSRIFSILSETGQSLKAPPTKFSPWQKLDKKLNRLNILKCVFLVNYCKAIILFIKECKCC